MLGVFRSVEGSLFTVPHGLLAALSVRSLSLVVGLNRAISLKQLSNLKREKALQECIGTKPNEARQKEIPASIAKCPPNRYYCRLSLVR